MYLLQAINNNYEAADKLISILERADDDKLMTFFGCLYRSDQEHIVRLICGDVRQSQNIPPGNLKNLKDMNSMHICRPKYKIIN